MSKEKIMSRGKKYLSIVIEKIEKKIKRNEFDTLPLGRNNFIMMAVAGAMIVIGFLLMLGGSSTEEAFNPDIFSARRIKVAPLVSLAGFVFVMVAIMYRGRKDEDTKDEDRTTSLR